MDCNLIGLHNVVSNLKYHDDYTAFSTVLPAELCFHGECRSGAIAVTLAFSIFTQRLPDVLQSRISFVNEWEEIFHVTRDD